ncbi:MAG: hypothetical protein IJ191_09160 [Treponema sp.]|nr:hypothetical protein [Treponema sp.]
MKAAFIIIGALLLAVLILLSVCIQIFRAWRNTNKKLNEANTLIATLEKRVENEKAKQEILSDEQKKSDADKEKLHSGTNGDKFNAANELLRKRQN